MNEIRRILSEIFYALVFYEVEFILNQNKQTISNMTETETLPEQIFRFAKECGIWVKCHPTLSHRKMLVQIVLQDNTLSSAYLFITHEPDKENSDYKANKECLLVPITKSIQMKFNETALLLQFPNHEDKALLLKFDTKDGANRRFEIFVSQFNITSNASKNAPENEMLFAFNDLFLSKYATPPRKFAKLVFYNPETCPCIVSPILFDKEGAYETWIKRNQLLNQSAFTSPEEIKVCCLTWNVGGGGHPGRSSKVLEDLTKVAEEDYDMYFFAFQEIDMSIPAIVGGNSSMADEWADTIKKAFENAEKKNNQADDTNVKKDEKSSKKGKRRDKSMGNLCLDQMKISTKKKVVHNYPFLSCQNFNNTAAPQIPLPPSDKKKVNRNIPMIPKKPKMNHSSSTDGLSNSILISQNEVNSILVTKDEQQMPGREHSYSVLANRDPSESDQEIDLVKYSTEHEFSTSFPILSQSRSNMKLFSPIGHRLIKFTSLGGVFIAVVVRNELPVPIIFERPKKIRLGKNGMTANKSAIIFPAKIGEYARINFVGCHLSAHQDQTKKRNRELKYLLHRSIRDITCDDSDSDESNIETSDEESETVPVNYNENISLQEGHSSRSSIYLKHAKQSRHHRHSAVTKSEIHERSHHRHLSDTSVFSDESDDATEYQDDSEFEQKYKKVDFLVLMGDLNYRIDMNYADCIRHIQDGDIKMLLARDQLNIAKLTDKRIAKFDEGTIDFIPTYKYDKKSNIYDTSPKQRIPSYCDRVLIVTNDNNLHQFEESKGEEKHYNFESDIVRNLYPKQFGDVIAKNEKLPLKFKPKPEILSYRRIENQFSDHRPVECVLKFIIPMTVPKEFSNFLQFQAEKINELSELSKPDIEPKNIDVDASESKRISLTFTNKSVAWAYWHATTDPHDKTRKFEDKNITVNPTKGIIFPGHSQTLEVKLSKNGTKITKKTVYLLSPTNQLMSKININIPK